MTRQRPGLGPLRRKGPRPFVSSFDSAAARWRHSDFEYDIDSSSPEPVKPKDVAFHFLNLQPPFLAPASVILPAYDAFGWPHGDAYTPLLKARTVRQSTRAVMPGIRLTRLHHALSMSEFRILMKLALHPACLDLREQYGVYNRQALRDAEAKGVRMRRQDLMTIDVVITYALAPDFQLKYHAISVKSPEHQPDDADLSREARERDAMAARGWTWELLRGDAVPMTEFVNLRYLYNLAREQDLPSLVNAARLFAPVVLRSSNRGSFDAVMLRVSRNMGISSDAAYHRFTAAVVYGFLEIDHDYPLRTDKRLELVRRNRQL